MVGHYVYGALRYGSGEQEGGVCVALPACDFCPHKTKLNSLAALSPEVEVTSSRRSSVVGVIVAVAQLNFDQKSSGQVVVVGVAVGWLVVCLRVTLACITQRNSTDKT